MGTGRDRVTLRLNWSRLTAIAVMIASFTLLLAGVVTAAETKGVVEYRVTPAALTITLTDGTAVFRGMLAGTTSTTASEVDDDLRVTNDGDIAITHLDIKINDGSADNPADAEGDCEPNGVDWEFDTDGGTFSATNENTFTMQVDSTDGMTNKVPFATEGTDVTIPNTGLSAGSGVDIDLQLTLANVITTVGETCTIDMTITAIAAP